MLTERERREFDEIVHALRNDSLPDAAEPLPRAAAVVEQPPGRWQRLVAWADRRFERRRDRRGAVICRVSRRESWRT